MVVRHLHFIGLAILEAKADPLLIVDGDGVLALSIAAQGVEPIAGRDSEIIKLLCEVNMLQLSYGSSDDVRRQPPRLARKE